jgi:MgsA AAA+ ATPase C terminal
MSNQEIIHPFKLDPWTASSLLQKAIRRGDAEFAKHAARTLYRQRGKGVWRRLMVIAFEDVGIAEPALVSELVVLASDQAMRAVLGDDIDLILDLSARLATAPKDRSADYLFCAGLKLPESHREQASFSTLNVAERVEIAADPDQPLLRRTIATLISCTVDGSGAKVVSNEALARLVALLNADCPSPLHEATAMAARKGCDPIILMVPLLWSAMPRELILPQVVDCAVPPEEMIGGIPLYTFDKHTSAGKHAISLFAQENREVADILAKHVPNAQARDVALIAAFYADGMPVTRRLIWSKSQSLEDMGFEADMVGAGCRREGILPIAECVKRNLDQLNDVRRRVVSRRIGL